MARDPIKYAKYQITYRKKNAKRLAAYKKKYNKMYQKKNAKELREYQQRYRAEHKEEKIKYLRQWKKDNPNYDREWQEKNRDKKNTNQRKWVQENLSKVKAMSAKRAAKIAKAGGAFTAVEWDELKKKHKNHCLGCGLSEKQLAKLGRSLVPDHVIPVSKGGTSNIDNLQPLCHCYKRGSRGGCNNRKRATIIDYR